MNLGEFYNAAVKIAEEQGYNNPRVSTISGTFEGMLYYSVNLHDYEKRKNIYSGSFSNSDVALEGFKDKLIELSKKQRNEPQMY